MARQFSTGESGKRRKIGANSPEGDRTGDKDGVKLKKKSRRQG